MSFESSSQKFELWLDTSVTAVANYKQLCPLNIDFDQGETMDSWNTLCSNLMNNVKVSLDPTWSTSFKFNKTDEVAQFIIGKEFSTGANANCKAIIVNLLKGTVGKNIQFTAVLSGINYSAVTEEVLEVSFDIKVSDSSTFVEIDHTLSSV